MLNLDKLEHYQRLFKDITLEDLQKLFQLTREKHLKEGDRYIDIGSTNRRLAYVKTGLVRAYFIEASGQDTTLLVRWEDQFFADMDTILWDRPSRFCYEALEDTVLLEADYFQFMEIVDASPKFATAKSYFLQLMLAETLERLEGFVLLTPEQRYLQLIEQKNSLAQRLPSKHLASLLGITPVSLSRIRKRIADRR
jgi:CRP-like cAMP-binding protein